MFGQKRGRIRFHLLFFLNLFAAGRSDSDEFFAPVRESINKKNLLTLYQVLTALMVNGVAAHPPMLGKIEAPTASQTIFILLKTR